MLASKVAASLGGRLLGDDVAISHVAPLTHAHRGALSFVIWPQDIRRAKKSCASCLIMPLEVAADYADVLKFIADHHRGFL